MTKLYAIQDRVESYAGNGLLASSSDGASWASALMDTPNVYLRGAACDASGDTIVLLTSDSQYVRRSMDGGSTWTTVNTGYPGLDVFTIKYVNNKFVTCSTYGEALISSTGSSWTSVVVSSTGLGLYDVAGVSGALVFATSEDMLYLADGSSEGTVTGPSGFSAARIHFLNGQLIAVNNAFEVYATTIATSTNGTTWTTTELDTLSDYNNIRLMDGDNIVTYAGGFYWILYWRPTTPSGTAAVKLLKSADGVSWSSVVVASSLVAYDLQTNCSLQSIDDTLIATTYLYGNRGLKASTTGTSWTEVISDDSNSVPYMFLFKSGTVVVTISEFWQNFVSSYEVLSET